MSRLSNIKQDNKTKNSYQNDKLVILLQTKKTRQELKNILGIADSNVRENIAICSYYYPVISYSQSKGYRIAEKIENLTSEDLDLELEEVEHTLNEINSRIVCLKKRMKPLIAYKKMAEKLKEMK